MNERHDQAPDGSLHPAQHRNSFGVDRTMAASPDEIFDAWTNHFDTWFASSGEISINAEPGAPYWFDVYHQGEHYAHFGRFLRVEAGRMIEQTWVSGRNGRDGREGRTRSLDVRNGTATHAQWVLRRGVGESSPCIVAPNPRTPRLRVDEWRLVSRAPARGLSSGAPPLRHDAHHQNRDRGDDERSDNVSGVVNVSGDAGPTH
jgi:hypothetical protein